MLPGGGCSSAAKPVSPAITTAVSPRLSGVKTVSESGMGAGIRPSRIMNVFSVASSSGTEPEGPACQVAPIPRYATATSRR